MNRRRVLLLIHEDCVPPERPTGGGARVPAWQTEHDVLTMLRQLGHHVRVLAVSQDLRPIREAVAEFQPHVAFVLLEEFDGSTSHVPYIVGYLQLLGVPFTGCGPESLILAADKALQKRILRHFAIPTPDFAVFPRGRRVRRPTGLSFPLIVKSTTAHGSACIAQASLVNDEQRLKQRVEFVHEQLQTDAIAEQYIEGRELYVGLLGNQRVTALPVWELAMRNLPLGAPVIATERLKWDTGYQRRVGLVTHAADGLSRDTTRRIRALCRRAYRALQFAGYGRMDLRLARDDTPYLLECNPNPNLAYGDELADAADAAGIPYARLIERIVGLGIQRAARARQGESLAVA
ncbi:MAG: ATP-grasp domain-containing protein [Planctomycetes bacterium]|nr:ATP-grasp domain-containing protein [Planctomycetota bacterium]